jgi:hypothetical protein
MVAGPKAGVKVHEPVDANALSDKRNHLVVNGTRTVLGLNNRCDATVHRILCDIVSA